MKQQFTSVAQIAEALKDTDMIDSVVQQMAGKNKILRTRLMDVVERYFIADARVWPDDRVNSFAQELYNAAYVVAEPA